jgi:hypothetical protein
MDGLTYLRRHVGDLTHLLPNHLVQPARASTSIVCNNLGPCFDTDHSNHFSIQ